MKISEEHLDFLTEMMNVGAGNAAVAFSQIIGQPVNVEVPMVKVVATEEIPSVLEKPSLKSACVRMDMLGDIRGSMFFIVPEKLVSVLAKMSTDTSNVNFDDDIIGSVIEEIGNIVAGTYLLAIHDFCKLNIIHKVPEMIIDMPQSVIDESFASQSLLFENLVFIENKFTLSKIKLNTFLLIIPSLDYVDTLVNSIDQARAIMRGE